MNWVVWASAISRRYKWKISSYLALLTTKKKSEKKKKSHIISNPSWICLHLISFISSSVFIFIHRMFCTLFVFHFSQIKMKKKFASVNKFSFLLKQNYILTPQRNEIQSGCHFFPCSSPFVIFFLRSSLPYVICGLWIRPFFIFVQEAKIGLCTFLFIAIMLT